MGFSNKLSKYNVSVKGYQESFQIEVGDITMETEEKDNCMDFSPSHKDVSRSSPIQAPLLRIATQATASSNITRSFLTCPLLPHSKQLQRAQTQFANPSLTAKLLTPQNVIHSGVTQPKKKNRIESIQKPTSTFRSPRYDIFFCLKNIDIKIAK